MRDTKTFFGTCCLVLAAIETLIVLGLIAIYSGAEIPGNVWLPIIVFSIKAAAMTVIGVVATCKSYLSLRKISY